MVRPGRESAYEAWVHDVGEILTDFDGAEGVTVLPPGTAHSGPEWVLVLRFRDYDAMVRWKRSNVRARWLQRLDDLTLDPGAWEEQTGLEAWFTLEGRPAPTGPPPRWKQFVLTSVGLVPLLLVSNALTAPLTTGWPGWLRTVVVTPALVALMTWAVMPMITRAAYGWLYPGPG
jgi:antibiotic biosynthesis monooxygenase (ABM) superfamily enzyme